MQVLLDEFAEVNRETAKRFDLRNLKHSRHARSQNGKETNLKEQIKSVVRELCNA